MFSYLILFFLIGSSVQLSIERDEHSETIYFEKNDTEPLKNLETNNDTVFYADIRSSTSQNIDNQNRLHTLEKKISHFNSFLKRITNYKAKPIVLLNINAHSTQITCMTALSNNQLATGSTDQTIKIFNLNDGTLVRHLKGHTGTINSIVLLTNGNLASGSADNTIREWSLNDGSLKKSMTEHTSSVLKLSILGVNLISGSDDSKIKIWPIANMNLNYYDYHTARSKGTLERHKSFIQSLVALPNGYLASGSNDFEINIWDTETNRIIKTFKGHSGTVNCLIGLQNGNIVSSSEDMTVREWKWNEREENRTNITSGNQLSKILFAGEIVTSMVLLKDNHLAMSHFRKVTILNLKTGIVTQTLNEFTTWVRCLTLLSNGNLVTATDDGKIKVWNLDEERITLNEIKEMINNELGGLESA